MRAFALPCLLLSACVVSPPPETSWEAQLDRDVWRDADPAAFDSLDGDAIWSHGDVVRYAVASDTADGGRRWTLEFRLPRVPTDRGWVEFANPDPVSGFVRSRSALWGTLTDKRTKQKLVRYSRSKTAMHVRLSRDDTGEVFETDVETMVHGHVWQESVDTKPMFGLDFTFHVLLKVKRLLDELLTVIQPPSITSVIGNGMKVYVHLEYRPEHLERVEVDSPFGRVPAFWLPVTLMANDQPALDCRFLITWRRSPLLLSCGILRIEGRHPNDPTKRLSVRVVHAKRGLAAQVIDRDDLGEPGMRRGMTEEQVLAALDGIVHRRYRVRRKDGTPIALLTIRRPPPHRRRVAAFVGGKLVFLNSAGAVGRFFERRGVPGPLFKKENLVEEERR